MKMKALSTISYVWSVCLHADLFQHVLRVGCKCLNFATAKLCVVGVLEFVRPLQWTLPSTLIVVAC